MNNKILIAFSAAALMLACNVSGADNIVTLPNGRVLKNPYIVDQTPTTVSVGHDGGGLTLKIKDLPENIQKQLGYDPKKAAAFEAEQKKEAAKEEKQKKKNAEAKKEQARKNAEFTIRNLKSRIRKLKIELETDQKNLQNVEGLFKYNKNAVSDLASVTSTNGGGYYSYWGYNGVMHNSRTSAASKEIRIRRREIKKMDEENDRSLREYDSLSKKITKKKIELGELEDRLERLQKKYPDIE